MKEKVILIIEDEPTINRILSMYFRKAGAQVYSALDGRKGLELFSKYDFDLVCLDIMLPLVNGWKVAETIRETSKVPIIMMSALSEDEDILKGYSLEVDDYITKPFTPTVLVAKIRSLFKRIDIEHNIETVLNIHGLNFEFTSFQNSHSLEQLLTSDELTGVANRRFLDFYLDQSIKKAIDFNLDFGLLFLDIDYFKKVNDTYGHQTGDVILHELAQLVKNNLRNEDLIGRYGGEEFLVVLRIDNSRHLKVISEKLRKAIESHVFDKENTMLKITVSIGGTMFKEKDTIDDIISRADDAMYISKKNGRNKTTLK